MTNMKIYAHEMEEATTLVKKTALKLNELESLKALMAQIEEDIFQLEHQMTLNDALLPHLENGGMTHNGWHFHAEQRGISKSVYHEPCTKMSTIEALKGGGSVSTSKNALNLKWGSVKGWEIATDEAKAALQKWADFGVSMSAAMQKDSPEQKEALIAAMDHFDEFWLDWDGKQITREEAKDYVRNYGQDKEQKQ